MPQDISQHTFDGGMNKDVSKTRLQPNQYWDAKNITVSLNEEGNLAALTNIKGNTNHFSIPYWEISGTDLLWKNRSDDHTLTTISLNDIEITSGEIGDNTSPILRIVGYTTIRNILVLLIRPKVDVNGLSIICTIDLENLNDHSYPQLKYIGKLNFPLSPIDVEGNYESETIQKIYWADGTNELGHFNIADTDGYTLNANQLFLNANVDFNAITINSVESGGSFNAGIVQYVYQYYNNNGTESTFSPITAPISLTNDLYLGASETSTVSRKISLSITTDANWENIRVFRLLKTTSTGTPNISLLLEQPNITTINIIDDGSINLRTITLSELTLYKLFNTIPKNIKTKDSRLLLGNYSQLYYTPEYDARAYRFNDTTTTTLIEDLDGNTYTINSANDYKITHKNGVSVGTAYVVPETHDCINADNANSVFSGNMYQPTGVGPANLGAKGLNVTVSFTSESIGIDSVNTTNYKITKASNYVGDDNTSMKRSWRRDEIYRVAVILTSNKGVKSLPKWICDLRIPSNIVSKNTSTSSTVVSANYIYPTFTFNNLPDDCVGVEVVRVPRTEENKTVLSQGYLLPTIVTASASNNYPIGTWTIGILEDVTPTYEVYTLPTSGIFDQDLSVGDLVFIPLDATITSVNLVPGSIYEVAIAITNGDNVNTIQDAGPPFPLVVISSYSYDELLPGQLLNSNYSNGSIINDKLINRFGFVDRSICTFYSPELSIDKALSTSSDNYFAFAGHLDVNGEYHNPDNVSYTTGTSGFISSQSSLENRYNFAKQQTYLSDVTDERDETITILDSAILKEDESDILVHSSVSYPVENVQILTTTPSEFVNVSKCSTTMFCLIDTLPDLVAQDSLPTFYYKKPLVNQYGGNTYSARLSNQYIVASDYVKASTNSATITAKQGDTFIAEWNHFLSYYTEGEDTRNHTFSGILFFECDYDLARKTFADMTSPVSGNTVLEKIDYIINTWRDETTSDGYTQNKAYSVQNSIISYFNTDIELINKDYINQFIISNVKFNSETVDSWLKFGVNDYLDVDGKYGPINAIKEVNDTIIFFQDNAIGQLSINPKAIASTTEGNIVLGTGGVLDDYKYISTISGCKHRESILKTAKGLYYYDVQNSKLRILGDEQAPLSDVKGLHNYLKSNVGNINNNPIQADGVTSGYDYSTNKVYFTFHAATPFTLQLDETLGNVECFVDCNPLLWITTRQGIFSTISESSYSSTLSDALYEMGVGQYGKFFNTLYSSYIEFIVNKNPEVIKTLNNLEFFSEVSINNVETTTNSFDYLRVYNNYQDTMVLPLTQNSRFKIFERKWRLFVPRNLKPYEPTILSNTPSENVFTANSYVLHPVTFYLYKVKVNTSTYTLPSNNSLDQSIFERVKTPLDRMRDFFNIVNLKFTNDGTSKLICHDILVKYDFNV